MSNCLHSLVTSLPGIIIICGLIALFWIVFFDTRARGRRKTVNKFREPGKIKCDIHSVTANPNAPKDIAFDTDDFLVKVQKGISPDSSVCLEIFPKEQFVPGSNGWQVQVATNAQEDRSSDEQSYVLTFQYLQNTLRIFPGITPGTSRQVK